MSLLSDNIFPGKHGKVFRTNAKFEDDLYEIKKFLKDVDGIKEFEVKRDKFPVEIKIYTHKIVKVKDLVKKFKKTGFHLIDKNPI
jgi:copper chaperone CopZ